MSSSNDWVQLYHRSICEQEMQNAPSFNVSDQFSSTMNATEANNSHLTSTSSHVSREYNLSSANDAHMFTERHVSKPNRKRARASRKAQTTLLNTDITNFRAMVQQFTGVPKPLFSSVPHINIAGSFSSGLRMMPLQGPPYAQQQQQEQHQLQQQQQQEQQRFIQLLNSRGDVLVPGGLNRNSASNMENLDSFLMEEGTTSYERGDIDYVNGNNYGYII